MKSIRLIAPALVAVCLLVVPLAWSQGGNVEQQIKKLTDQLIAAELKADTSSYEKLLAEDYTGIYSNGRLVTKAQDVEDLKSGALKYESIDLREIKIRAYGYTAVAVSLVSTKSTRGGKSISADYRVTRVWVKRKGNWKTVAFQATRVAPPSQ
jgi:hypothetical protein